MTINHYLFAQALLEEYRDEATKAETSIRSRRGLASDGPRILALAQAHATLAVVDALSAAKAAK